MVIPMNEKNLREMLFVFFKGVAMGSADIVPGVSGGTIALITGIYERFVFALKSIHISFLYYLFLSLKDKKNLKKAKKSFFSIDFVFLIPLAAGIAFAFLTLANLIGFLLETIPTQTFAFFFGLILASAFFVYYNHKPLFGLSSAVFILLGCIIGFIVVGLESIYLESSLIMIFASGIISLCAMILPGLSGAFVLLVLGQYTFLLNILRDLTQFEFGMIGYVFAYGLGGVIGLLGFSRVLSFLFLKYKSATIACITGLMIGALRKPGVEIISHPETVLFSFFSIVLGVLVVTVFGIFECRYKKNLPNQEELNHCK